MANPGLRPNVMRPQLNVTITTVYIRRRSVTETLQISELVGISEKENSKSGYGKINKAKGENKKFGSGEFWKNSNNILDSALHQECLQTYLIPVR